MCEDNDWGFLVSQRKPELLAVQKLGFIKPRGWDPGMSSLTVKILALLAFNLGVLGASLFLLTYTPTTSLSLSGNVRGGLPFARFVQESGGLNFSVIGVWAGMAVFWLVGNAAIGSVKTEKQA